jgi:surface antigen
MNRLLSLVRGGKALTNMVTGKREALSSEQAALEARAKMKDLEWYLADNISNVSGVRRSKKARSLTSRVP